MKKKLAFFSGILLIVGLGITDIWLQQQEVSPVAIGWAGKKFAIERADTEQAREKGLGGRESLCSSCAMLFVFPRSGNYGFWMKDMKFPLDIIWIYHGMVVHIERNIHPDSKEVFLPKKTADQVLEVNAGEAAMVSEGERLKFY